MPSSSDGLLSEGSFSFRPMVVPISHCLWDLNLSSGTSGPGRLPSVLLEFWCFVSHRCPRSALPLPFLSGHKNPLRSPPPALRSRGVSVPLPILCPPSLGPPVSARTGCELVSLLMSSFLCAWLTHQIVPSSRGRTVMLSWLFPFMPVQCRAHRESQINAFCWNEPVITGGWDPHRAKQQK